MDSLAMRPKYWEQLSFRDQAAYTALQQEFAAPSRKNRRNRSLQTFGEIIDAVKRFVIQHDEDDWKRALVCGICWSDSTIGLNTRQLRLLISKCKSSINGCFQLLGYGIMASGGDCNTEIVKILPILKDNFTELRQWTLRYTGQPTPFVSPAPETLALPEAIALPDDSFALIVFDDPLSFVQDEPEATGWLEVEEDTLAKAPKDFDFSDIDL
jgi:hypothetical protein